MSRRPKPTHDQVLDARIATAPAARAVGAAVADAVKPLIAVANAAHPAPADVVAAVAAMRTGLDAADALVWALLAHAVTGGAAITTTARAVGVRPETLAAKIAGHSGGNR